MRPLREDCACWEFRRCSAHQAITAAKAYIADGRRWVVNLDLSKFFDRVNHDILMERLSRRIHDKGLLKLIRSWLTAGMMADGVVNDRTEGTPQGGPAGKARSYIDQRRHRVFAYNQKSKGACRRRPRRPPLLANILLDELDKKLEAAGHKFCRYADDCNVYVRSKRAGERVMKWMRGFLEGKLKLKVNETKSAVDQPWKSKFLGISFTRDKKPKVRVASQSLKRFKERIRRITSRRRGISLERMVAELNRYLIGWRGYFRIAETPSVMQRQDGWIRRRLRCFIMKQWKRARTIYRELTKRGAPEARNMAGSGKGWWRLSKTKASHMALGVDYFRSLGLASLAEADGPAA